MKYNLVGKIIFNKDITPNKEKVIEFIKQAENDILKKITDLEEINFTSEYKIENKNSIQVIICTKKKSAHIIFYRIRKSLAEYLGKNLHIGISSLEIKFLKIVFPLEKLPQEDISIPFVNVIEFDKNEKTCAIELEKIDKNFITKGNVERIIKRIREKIDHSYYEGKKSTIKCYMKAQKRI